MISNHGRPAPAPKNGHSPEVLIYGRVSVAEERTGGHTLHTQQARVHEQFDQLYGPGRWQGTVIEDDGVSGRYGTRPTRSAKKVRKGLLACAMALDAGRFDDFAVYSLSRLARDNVITEEFLKEHVLANGTRFHSATEDIDLSTPQGWLTVRIITAVSANMRESGVERTRDGAAMRVEQGYYLGQVGYGWRWAPVDAADGPAEGGKEGRPERRRILPIPEQAQWVTRMKDRYLAGWSPRRIAGELNALGVPPPETFKGRAALHKGTPASGKWVAAVVAKVLFQPTHAGLLLTRDGRQVQAEFHAHRFFDPEVREQLLAAREARKRFPTNTDKEGNAHLLNGLITCARCGKRLYPATYSGGKYPCYRCFGGHAHGARTCPNIVAKEQYLDAAVAAEIERLAREPTMRRLLEEEADGLADAQDAQLRAEAAQLRGRLEELNAQFLNWAALASRKSVTPEQFEAFNDRLRADQAEAQGRLTRAEAALAGRDRREAQAARVRALLADLPELWRTLGLPERREVLTQVVEKLALDRDADGRTPLLTIKLLLLPERTVRLVQAPPDRKRKFSVGVAALTPRQLALLHWVDQGKTLAEAAALMQVTAGCLQAQQRRLQKTLGTADLTESAAKARSRVHAELSTLPLHGLRSPLAVAEGGVYLSEGLLEALRLYASGAQTKQIAGMLHLPETTVAGRRTRILSALGVPTIYDAVQKARQAGLL